MKCSRFLKRFAKPGVRHHRLRGPYLQHLMEDKAMDSNMGVEDDHPIQSDREHDRFDHSDRRHGHFKHINMEHGHFGHRKMGRGRFEHRKMGHGHFFKHHEMRHFKPHHVGHGHFQHHKMGHGHFKHHKMGHGHFKHHKMEHIQKMHQQINRCKRGFPGFQQDEPEKKEQYSDRCKLCTDGTIRTYDPKSKAQVTREDNKFHISLDTSSYQPEEVSVKIVNGKIDVSAIHESVDEDLYEFHEMYRSFNLPEGVDPDTVTSHLDGDTLIIEAPMNTEEESSHVRDVPVTRLEDSE